MENLYNKLESYNKQNYCPMHMPGHKRNTELLGSKLPYNIDITEIDGFDDLHNSQGVIKEIQEKAKKLFGPVPKSFVLFPKYNLFFLIICWNFKQLTIYFV